MSGPIETTGFLILAGLALIAVVVVPLPKHKPEPAPPAKPPAFERLAPDPDDAESVSRVAPAIEPEPELPTETEDQRIEALERSVHEIKKDQQELKDDIRALVQEIKAK